MNKTVMFKCLYNFFCVVCWVLRLYLKGLRFKGLRGDRRLIADKVRPLSGVLHRGVGAFTVNQHLSTVCQIPMKLQLHIRERVRAHVLQGQVH